jgi:hypothetical protein
MIPFIKEKIIFIQYNISNLFSLYVDNMNKTNKNIENFEFLNNSVTIFENNFENKILILKNDMYNVSNLYAIDMNISIDNIKNEISLNKNISLENDNHFLMYKNSSDLFMDIIYSNISSIDTYIKDINKSIILNHEYIDNMNVSLQLLNYSVLSYSENVNTSIKELKNIVYDNNTVIINTINVLNKSVSEDLSHFWSMTETLTDAQVCIYVYVYMYIYI